MKNSDTAKNRATKKPGATRLNVNSVNKSLLRRHRKDTHLLGIKQTLSKINFFVKPCKCSKRVKDSIDKYGGQLKRVIESLKGSPKTMLQVSLETGILRANICRYVATLRKTDNIQVHHKGIDSITHRQAAFLTTNPALFKPSAFNFPKV